MKPLMTVVLLGLIGIVGYLGLVFALQRAVLFPRPAPPPRSPAEGRPDVEVAWIGPDRAVEAWYLSPMGAAPAQPVPVLVFTHGNGELIDYWLDEFEIVRSWGLGVLLVEYPGYGRSGGSPSEASITATMAEAYDFLASRPEVDAGRIVAYGRSVGGGAACALVRERPVAALILESSFSSVRRLARRHGLFGPLVRDPFDNLAVVRDFEGPVLVIHGRSDRLIPPAHGEALAENAPSAEFVLFDCGHNDCPRPWAEVRSFLARIGITGSPVDASVESSHMDESKKK
jgi:pimeloyl-ACP methyl ester carboxylesterase